MPSQLQSWDACDNCPGADDPNGPLTPNPSSESQLRQFDSDNDDVGDVCDVCPGQPEEVSQRLFLSQVVAILPAVQVPPSGPLGTSGQLSQRSPMPSVSSSA